MTDPTADAAKLLPCPSVICPSHHPEWEAGVVASLRDETLGYRVMCAECDASTGYYAFADEAVAAWNTRWNTRPLNASPPASVSPTTAIATVPGYGGRGYSGPYPGSSAAPPEGEPDFGVVDWSDLPAQIRHTAESAATQYFGDPYDDADPPCIAKFMRFAASLIEHGKRLAFAARPKVEDAEVAEQIRLARQWPRDCEGVLINKLADLVERLAGDFGQLQAALELANEDLSIVDTKLAEREAELARADAVIAEMVRRGHISGPVSHKASQRHAARLLQKALAKPDKSHQPVAKDNGQ